MPQSPHTPIAVVRLLDASLNRASEGTRVVEDYARFVLDDGHLSKLAKELRHGIAAAGEILPAAERLAARDTPGDVGTTISTDREGVRTDAWAVCQASLGRLQEALRSLEEYAKTIDSSHGAEFERLRYATYTLAKGLGATRSGLDRLGSAKLYGLIDGGASEDAFASTVATLCEAGIDVLQLRDKRLGDRDLASRAKQLARVCREHGVISIVNDRPDIALVCGADGVHVGQEELTVSDARKVVGPKALVGVSTHSIEQARTAVLDGADYLGVGPTFPTQTKSFEAFPGLDLVRAVAGEIALPAFAIGGITVENLPSVLDAGPRRVAVSSAITGSDDPAKVIGELKELLAGPVGGGESRG